MEQNTLCVNHQAEEHSGLCKILPPFPMISGGLGLWLRLRTTLRHGQCVEGLRISNTNPWIFSFLDPAKHLRKVISMDFITELLNTKRHTSIIAFVNLSHFVLGYVLLWIDYSIGTNEIKQLFLKCLQTSWVALIYPHFSSLFWKKPSQGFGNAAKFLNTLTFSTWLIECINPILEQYMCI